MDYVTYETGNDFKYLEIPTTDLGDDKLTEAKTIAEETFPDYVPTLALQIEGIVRVSMLRRAVWEGD